MTQTIVNFIIYWREMMDIEYSQESNNEQEFEYEPISKKNDKKFVLSHEAESIASSIMNRRSKNVEFNRALDPNNTAVKCSMGLRTKQFGSFQHFMTKIKNNGERLEVMNVLRELAHEKGLALVGRVSDKLERSKMILRVISKEQGSGLVIIEDETGKDKMQVKMGTVWVGMIACMDVTWVDGGYRLENINDLGAKFDNLGQKTFLREPTQAFRVLFVKGSFSKNDSKEIIGIKIIINEIRHLRQKQKTKIDCVVVFGPLLNSKNTSLTSGFSDFTYEEQANQVIRLISDEISKISEQIDLVFVPSTEDLISLYPIPQPKYSYDVQLNSKKIHYTSNPGHLVLSGAKQNYTMNLLNTDILNYIDEQRTGRAINEVLQDNLETYFKQPFYLTNTLDEPFDEVNLAGLYNGGNFGNIIVTSSRKSPPFAREIKGRVYVNIGCLGIDNQNQTQKHYMTLVSLYDGDGPVAPRIKVESLTM